MCLISFTAICKRRWRRSRRFLLSTAAAVFTTYLFMSTLPVHLPTVAEQSPPQPELPVAEDTGPPPVAPSELSDSCLDNLLGRPLDGLPCLQQPIDAVYIWTNGSDEQLKRQLAEALKQPGRRTIPDDAVSLDRFTDSDGLRYSLRSLEQYAPWVRQVHLVTNGQVPSWLDLNSPRITLVSHESIFPDRSHLPTFSRSAVETHLHRIFDLSEHFLYFDNDFLLAQPVRLEDFVDPSGEYSVYLAQTVPSSGPQHNTSSNSQDFMDRLFSQRYGAAKRHVVGHVPHLRNRSIVAELESTFADEFARTSAECVSSPTSMQLSFAYFNFLMLEREVIPTVDLLAEVNSDSAGVWRDADLRSLLRQLRELGSTELPQLRFGGVRQFRHKLRRCADDYAALMQRIKHTPFSQWPSPDPDPEEGSCMQLLLQLQLLPVTRPKYRYRILSDDVDFVHVPKAWTRGIDLRGDMLYTCTHRDRSSSGRQTRATG